MTTSGKYRFPEPMLEGLIRSRPNRFIMMVEAGGGTVRCHCPSTGRIGDIRFDRVPCLLSRGGGRERRTEYTVEAISLDSVQRKRKRWIGINQTQVNRYVEHLLRHGALRRIATGTVLRERRVGTARIDFLVGKTLLEVKMPLISLPAHGRERMTHQKFNSFDRLIKHFGELSKAKVRGQRAVILLCYLYDAPPFRPPKEGRENSPILAAARRATRRGVERWQANLSIDENGVALREYFRLRQF